ncbi:MAG TPA: hypothetical protein PKV70_02560, partial [Thermodesulfobacteriota bacterium]|nr:hypothetical protein [Thermodesulfobacteriota bacterium]
MSDEKKAGVEGSGMPGEIGGSGEAPPKGPGKKKRRWIYYVVAIVVALAGGDRVGLRQEGDV